MGLDQLTVKEWLYLASKAEREWVRRLREMADRVRETDPELALELDGMAAEEHAHFDRLSERNDATPWPDVWHIDSTESARLLGEHFPCLTSRARPRADRDNITPMVDAVERECAGFYHYLADRAPDDDTRAFFRHMAQLEEEHRDTFLP